MSDTHDEAGLGDFLEFAADDAVCSEILGRGDYGLVMILKPAKSNSNGRFDLQVKYKLPQELVEEHGKEKALHVLLDILKATVDVS